MSDKQNGEKTSNNAELNSFLIGTAFLVIPLWLVVGCYLPRLTNDPGGFGDMFGGVNALFSGLAFAAIIFTIRLQREDLRLQKEELTLTREELKGQKEQLEAQTQTFKQQAFENTFFQLLRLHNEIVTSIKIISPPSIVHGMSFSGRDCFNEYYGRLKKEIIQAIREGIYDPTDPVHIGKSYETDFYACIEQDLGHYFRSLYNIVKLVDQSPLEDKRIYTNIIRAQLSKYEVLLLFYNCISNLGYKKFKPLVEKYALLKMLNYSELISTNHCEFYTASAYGKISYGE